MLSYSWKYYKISEKINKFKDPLKIIYFYILSFLTVYTILLTFLWHFLLPAFACQNCLKVILFSLLRIQFGGKHKEGRWHKLAALSGRKDAFWIPKINASALFIIFSLSIYFSFYASYFLCLSICLTINLFLLYICLSANLYSFFAYFIKEIWN